MGGMRTEVESCLRLEWARIRGRVLLPGAVFSVTLGIGLAEPVPEALADGCSTVRGTTTCTYPGPAMTATFPLITITSPGGGASYKRGSRIRARFRCSESASVSPIATCEGTVPPGHAIDTGSVGTKTFRVIATDNGGNKAVQTVRYTVWAYVNPLSAVRGLYPGRIDMGVDYGGSGAILALGKGRVTMASDNDSGPLSCWGITCWPGGGVVVYRLLNGPFVGKYVYVAEGITISVRAGQTVRAGEQIATLYDRSPHMETGWASGKGPETLAIARGHQCTCDDPGGWSAIEGRNFDELLSELGAPSGYLQPDPPEQSMPSRWR